MRLIVLLGVAATTALLAAASPAIAAESSATADCSAHGRLTRSYSTAQLNAALETMPADLQEYTNCYDVIKQALLAQIPGTRHHAAVSKASSNGSFLSTPVIVAIAVLAVGGASAAGVTLRRRT
jgi:alkanesulfonate monooxygenase SsuD/methylene tetrahydromethanopterin reductase-like flavin-dependent oxidoreductase (luciferase family)